MATPTYTKAGAKATTAAKLDANVFGVEVKNHELLKHVYDAHLANGRLNLAVVKTRGLVSGGGRKPWKQKGTGRARFGSSRNPIWRGGGIVFGPTGLENYSKHVNVKAKRQALRQALSLANADNRVVVLESLESSDGKTAAMAKLLTKIGANGRVLLAVEHKTAELVRATSNLTNIKLVQAGYVNVYDVMNADWVVLTKPALEALTDRLLSTAASSATSSAKAARAPKKEAKK
jgi:large subunit ribosomal protein L4